MNKQNIMRYNIKSPLLLVGRFVKLGIQSKKKKQINKLQKLYKN